eukprot:6189644-Pleurochrysis_carterae.AAC.2
MPVIFLFEKIIDTKPKVDTFLRWKDEVHAEYQLDASKKYFSSRYLIHAMTEENAEEWMRYMITGVGKHDRDELLDMVMAILLHRSSFFLPMLKLMESEFHMTWKDIGVSSRIVRLRAATDIHIRAVLPVLITEFDSWRSRVMARCADHINP